MSRNEYDERDMRPSDEGFDTTDKLTTADMANAISRAPQSARANQGGPTAAQAVPKRSDEEGSEPLFAEDESEEFRSRWERIQAGFVDEPRMAVEQADELVATVIKRLAEVFAKERTSLEQDWDRGDDVSTEDLRIALRRYRSFFDRLLSV